MKYIILEGKDFEKDIETIRDNICKDSNIIFVYNGGLRLNEYIDYLIDDGDGLDDKDLYVFKVCEEKNDLSVSFTNNSNKQVKKISSMSSLLNELDGLSDCRIVVDNDERNHLSFIVQQLIYIGYPLEKIDILLHKEERDAKKTKIFMERIDGLFNGCIKSINLLEIHKQNLLKEEDSEIKNKRLENINYSIEACKEIKKNIEKAMEVELKIAVAAAKKSGKSVIVNGLIGEEIAPTSLELATPNNCFYRKSKDDKYYFQYEKTNDIKGAENFDYEKRSFDTCKEIKRYIKKEFKAAEKSVETRFLIPNMNIDYPSMGNNFSSYTIYDTPGPNAAGTEHWKAAKKALEKCDVAIFAIDYAKHLTEDENNYLEKVKNIFEQQRKFHSLIFVLNIIDRRYDDVNAPKSIIKTLAYIKNRIADIHPDYCDCIVFPTSALEFFDAMVVEKAGVKELLSENKFNIKDFKNLLYCDKYSGIKELRFLDQLSGDFAYFHGFKTISYDDFYKDSGMPAMMSYASYIARSKAKDEIVNNIAYKISEQEKNLQSIQDYIKDIEKFIDIDEKKLVEITDIIKDFKKDVDKIIDKNFTKDDLDVLDNSCLLKQNYFNGDYEKFINYKEETIEDYDEEIIISRIYNKLVDDIYLKLVIYSEKDQIDKNKLNNILTKDDFTRIVKEQIEQESKNISSYFNSEIIKVNKEVEKIIGNRQKRLQQLSNICKDKLKKKNVEITFPEFPDFEFHTNLPKYNDIDVKINRLDIDLKGNLDKCFEKDILESLGRVLATPVIVTLCIGELGLELGKKLGIVDKGKTLLPAETSPKTPIAFSSDGYSFSDVFLPEKFITDKKKFIDECDKSLKKDCENAIWRNKIPNQFKDQLIELVIKNYLRKLVDELKEEFNDMNKNYEERIKRFVSMADDRDMYKANIENYKKHKATINDIKEATADFMNIWELIINQ